MFAFCVRTKIPSGVAPVGALQQSEADTGLRRKSKRPCPGIVKWLWLARFFENDTVERTKREIRCRRVQLKRSTWLVLRANSEIVRC